MKEEIDSGLPAIGQPFSWALRKGGHVFTTHGPVTAEGKILQGSVEEQAELTLANMAATMRAAGGSLDDILQATVFLLDEQDMKIVDAVWRRHFRAPWPNRASIVVKGLVAPGMRVEVQATGIVDAS